MILCDKYGIINDNVEKENVKLLHAKTGAALARDLFGVSDAVYGAIRWHTTGKPDMINEKLNPYAEKITPANLDVISFDKKNFISTTGSMVSIISRYIFRVPVAWSYEISVLGYMWTMFFGVGKAMRRHSNDYIWNYRLQFGDWVALDAEEGSYFGATPNDLTCTAYFAYSTGLFAEICRILGRKEEEKNYRELYSAVCAKYQKTFFNDDGTMKAQTQTAHIVSLYFGLVPEKFKVTVTEGLRKLLAKENGHLVTGFVGTPYFCHAYPYINGKKDDSILLYNVAENPADTTRGYIADYARETAGPNLGTETAGYAPFSYKAEEPGVYCFKFFSENHGDGTGIDRADEFEEDVEDRKAHAEEERCPDGSFGDAFPVQAVQEGSKERSSQCTPGDSHQLGDEGRRINGQDDGENDEDNDQDAQEEKLLLFRHFLDQGSFDEVDRQR